MMSFFHSRGLFITGTDTEVGKTIVTGGLAAILREEGYRVGVMKPAESGCAEKDGVLLPADAEFLREMSGTNDPLDTIVPYRFKEPLAPAVAAEQEGVLIDIDKLVRNFEELSCHHDFVLVEGAGGLLVPLCRDFLMADLIKLLKVPLLIISRANLGTINHTLLTVRYAQAEQINIKGIVINNLSPERTLASETNPGVIANLCDVPLWGTLPYHHDIMPHKLTGKMIASFIREHVNLEYLYSLIQNKQKKAKITIS